MPEAFKAGGDAYLVVAAADTPITLKNRADFTCDGSNTTGGDQDEINAAFALSDAVVLCPGTFWIDGMIVMGSGQSLFGCGAASVLKFKDNIVPGVIPLNMIYNSDPVGGNDHITVKNVRLDGNRVNQLAGYDQYGIRFVGVGSGTGATATPGCKIQCCFVESFNRRSGIRLSYSNNNTVTGNSCQGNGASGISLTGSSNNTVTGNICQGNGGYGIGLTGSSNTVTGNICQGNGASGISLTGSSNNTVTGNICQGNGGYGIGLTGSSNTVTGNICQGNGASGISLSNSSNNNTVTGNICQGNGASGIFLYEANNNTVTGNTICSNGAYGIDFRGLSDYNSIENNYTSGNTSGCVNVTATCNNNVFTNNQFDEGDITDAGTNTRAWLNYDPSANAFITAINPPAVIGGGGGTLP